MAPTDSQINLIFKWISWKLPRQEAKDAVNWLEKNADRKEVSAEIARLHDLYHSNRLDKESLYGGEVWRDYNND